MYALLEKKSDSQKLIAFVEIHQLDKSSLKVDGISDKTAQLRFRSLFFTARATPLHLNNGLQEADLTVTWLRQSGRCPEQSSPSNKDRKGLGLASPHC